MDPLSPRARTTRDAILRAALACFSAHGFRATTTRAIAARAGVTQPLIHHYFGTKDALFEAVLAHAAEDYEAAQHAQWVRDDDDLAFMTDGLVVLFRWLARQREHMRLAAWARLERAEPPGPKAVALWTRVHRRLSDAQERGVLRADVDLDAAMLLIDAAFKGYWDRRDMLTTYPIDARDLDERYLRQTLDVLFVGLLTADAAARARAVLSD